MRALAKKRWRELWGLRGPAAAIALVLTCGVATFVGSLSMLDSLQATRAAFYREGRFADAFASLTRAPEPVAREVEVVPGVSAVETRVVALAALDVPGFEEPVTGFLVSLPDDGEPRLNRLHLRAGRLPEPGRGDEVVVSDAFAEAHGLRPGSALTAILNGRRETLRVVGLALSPEYVYQLPPGGFFPDFERFGILWMRRAPLAAAYGLVGAFNDVTLALAPGASTAEVLDRLDDVLASYGAVGAIARADQQSHRFLDEEFKQLAQSARVMPAIFLGVAAFLLSVVVSRLVQTQREEIATLKAFGYSTQAVAAHYAGLVLTIAGIGAGAGVLGGIWVGQAMSGLYMAFYRFPELTYRLRPGIVVLAVGLTGGLALLATLRAVWGAARLSPAVAMQPPAPPRYRVSLVERLGLRRWLSAQDRMILRHLGRRPIRAFLSALGIAMACAIVLLGRFSIDAIEVVMDVQFGRIHREDLQVSFVEARPAEAARELARLPGVRYAEPFRAVAAELRRGARAYDTGITGMPAGADLARVLDADLRPVALPPEGLVLSDYLAGYLGVGEGDRVTVAVKEGRQPVLSVPVALVVQEYIGAGAYMERRALNRLLGEGDLASGAWLAADEATLPALYDALRERPGVLGATALQQARASMEETFSASIVTLTIILTVFAGAIAFGVVYNTARIALEERARELASLRVLGFTRGEVGYLLLGELAVLTLLALPLGLVLGTLFSYAYVQGLQTDFFRMPLVLTRTSYTFAATLVVAASVLSGLIVWLRIQKLDLIGVLKTRE